MNTALERLSLRGRSAVPGSVLQHPIIISPYGTVDSALCRRGGACTSEKQGVLGSEQGHCGGQRTAEFE